MNDLFIYGYADNRTTCSTGEPEPLVHMMVRRHGDVQSISFDPKFAKVIAAQIIAVADAAIIGVDSSVKMPVCGEGE